MKNIITFQDHLSSSLKDKDFKTSWKKSQLAYQISRKIIDLRVKNKLSQEELAKRVKTTQAVISRLENMNVNPSLDLLQRIAKACKTTLDIRFLEN